ncbi:unnamed protein product [Callosobruchus maculatus]|uniref:Uncharacterized protein n=1 Tax=Callosobruchus maculatus TaxID=64391 RepID=A0A653DCQ7_CALMS|nr:unnamed protein product [Callosobruchus maculatus]
MATVPSTIVVFTEDKKNFPIKYAAVVMKQLFQYGVRETVARGDKIYISLTYSPRGKTLKRKFGNLPVKYMRAKIDKEEEFKILESVVKRYKFNLLSEELKIWKETESNRLQRFPSLLVLNGKNDTWSYHLLVKMLKIFIAVVVTMMMMMMIMTTTKKTKMMICVVMTVKKYVDC